MKAARAAERSPGRLSKAELSEARARLARLKFHPREALPNVTAIARADALYADLVGDARARLGRTLGAFRAVLETQDPPLIERHRDALVALVLELSAGR